MPALRNGSENQFNFFGLIRAGRLTLERRTVEAIPLPRHAGEENRSDPERYPILACILTLQQPRLEEERCEWVNKEMMGRLERDWLGGVDDMVV